MRYFDRAAATLIFTGLVFLTVAEFAHAQSTADGRSYVSAGIIGDVKRFSGDVDEPLFDGEAIGASIAIGSSVHPRWDVLLGIDRHAGAWLKAMRAERSAGS